MVRNLLLKCASRNWGLPARELRMWKEAYIER
jgi:hypothetical protein